MSFRRCELWRFVTSSIIRLYCRYRNCTDSTTFGSRTITAGRELHPAPKTSRFSCFTVCIITQCFQNASTFFQEGFDRCVRARTMEATTERRLPPCPSANTPAASPDTANTSCLGAVMRMTPRCRKLQQQLFDAVDAVCAAGIRHFICGMANGCDLYFSTPRAICASVTRRSRSRRPSPSPDRPTAGGRSCARAMITTCASATIRHSCRRRTRRAA